ncbi:30S ribosomal protein S5 [Candidatus Peribacteria bacterium RIFCSPLOWO2_12_FULL_55_15]|nr:MAG: 30S ribosomal protein S5 [Candidatus Peribacteria bacterium RIFCSPHIGHO2_01_FULL_54_22]OGJ63016.1 MAG: 30S ribosomal protein S5 [Candidatus Peribacteria bacterium RIFCSPHIGHO2_02_FULL_55_24]OGJ63920.1 MAG: 30S ribosomal protein S5 [Candidatus Peribacteria bacterium RIFCSPHIGHO2_12_FULL_54_10]OGJ68620.1 MAG: 30S ribosomal protein S5 [Candidatus Peribacteria bacterium RIFCSPLOWO2_01_FULL_54_110]OGJ68841.1 MAG: 30S ribosomal protein S5 [Candidatus Peribacteria bacterium RIFCSPLOWO2_02_FULL
MAKTSHPGRHHDRRKDPSEFAETTLSVDRVTRVVKGGRRMRFRAIVVVGDRKGRVGLGTGKANEVQVAVKKATRHARKNMVKVPLKGGTLFHDVDVKFKAARIRLIPACEGTGIIAGGAVRVILEHAGVRDVLSKRFGTANKLVNAQAVMHALHILRSSSAGVSKQESAPSKV